MAGGVVFGGLPALALGAPSEKQDVAILNYALTLEFLETAFYKEARAMAALARMGVASATLYRRQWRVALVAIALLAAILPGGDPFSMLLLMIPQIVLYAVGIALAARFGQAPLWRSGGAVDAP
jgi:hypothetical protein